MGRLRARVGSVLVVELSYGANLDLAYPFSRHAQPATDLLERQSRFAFQSIPQNQDGSFARLEARQPREQDAPLLVGFQHCIGWRVLAKCSPRRPSTRGEVLFSSLSWRAWCALATSIF